MKKIAIYSGLLFFTPKYQHYWDEKNLKYGNIGGSDKWAIEISRAFAKEGNHCILFIDCLRWHFEKVESGIVEYIPADYYERLISTMHFDIFISSRQIMPFFFNISAKRKILMFHENFIIDENKGDINLIEDRIDEVAIQSNSQKEIILNKYPSLQTKKIVKTCQAIDTKKYFSKENKKKNMMVWSSHKTRGLENLARYIYPQIRKEICDFELHICSYTNDNSEDYLKQEGIKIHKNVPQEELIRMQCESKVWIYPNFSNSGFNKDRPKETFCITAIENAAAGNALILPPKDSFIDIFEGYYGFVRNEYIDGKDCFDTIEDREKILSICDNFGSEAIKCLQDENYRLKLAEEASSISKKYTWENVVRTFLGE